MYPWVADLKDLFLPRTCQICGRTLLREEKTLCLHCIAQLPRLPHWKEENPADERLFGRFRFEHGASFCFYQSGNDFARLIQAAKYKGRPWVNYDLGRLAALELQTQGWPYDIDLIVPVPIHWRRLMTRGYNQVIPVGKALSEVWNIPMDTHLLRKSEYTDSQVRHTFEERLGHVNRTFKIKHPEKLEGHHVLLIDDVLTSGATLSACADILSTIPRLRLSFLTLGMTK
jgi:ComF family protein